MPESPLSAWPTFWEVPVYGWWNGAIIKVEVPVCTRLIRTLSVGRCLPASRRSMIASHWLPAPHALPTYMNTTPCWSLASQQHIRSDGYRLVTVCAYVDFIVGAERSLDSRALTCKGWDHPIEPPWLVHLQFGLFSFPTSGPQLVRQRLWYVLCSLWESAYKRSLAVYWKE